MINFMCRLEWPTGRPGIWSNIILGTGGEITFTWLAKADRSPHSLGWAGLSPALKAFEENKMNPPDLEKTNSSCLGTPVFPAFTRTQKHRFFLGVNCQPWAPPALPGLRPLGLD